MKKFLLAITLMVALVFAGTGYAFDTKPSSFDMLFGEVCDYPNLSRSIVHIYAHGTAVGFAPEFKDYQPTGKVLKIIGETEAEGSGFYIGNGLIITAAHVATPMTVTLRTSPSSYWEVPIWKRLENIVYVSDYPCELVWSNEEQDIAILRILDETAYKYFIPLPYKIKTGRGLYDGVAVSMITSKRTEDGEIADWQQEARYGNVISHYAKADPSSAAWFNTSDLTMDVWVVPGDSGSPLFAFENGEPVIVGIARARSNEYSYAVRIDPILPYIRNLTGENLEEYLPQW